jgi:hypothetical protein
MGQVWSEMGTDRVSRAGARRADWRSARARRREALEGRHAPQPPAAADAAEEVGSAALDTEGLGAGAQQLLREAGGATCVSARPAENAARRAPFCTGRGAHNGFRGAHPQKRRPLLRALRSPLVPLRARRLVRPILQLNPVLSVMVRVVHLTRKRHRRRLVLDLPRRAARFSSGLLHYPESLRLLYVPGSRNPG